jgi:hypothetical protein
MSEVKVNKISPRTNCGTTQLGDAGDTITVTGDLKSNSLKSASGSTITLGQSGDTIQLGCGASQTGFGRTGTVDWDTTAKTASFTAVSGNGYFVNTTSGAITLTLPASPSAGDIVAFKDYAFTFATNNLTVDGNGSPIGGVDGTINPTYNTNGTSKTFIYVDGTKGWLVTNESTDTSQESNALFITATGGTVTCCGDYKIHTFTGPGTFCVSCAGNPAGSSTVDYLVVAGGAGGGHNGAFSGTAAGAGGAGGYRESSGAVSGCYTASPLGACVSALPVSVSAYSVTVGSGGAGANGGATNVNGSSGSNSVFATITSAGGGYGGAAVPCAAPVNSFPGGNGGSGGGGSYGDTPTGSVGGSGNTPPVSPPQGQNGGRAGNPAGGSGGGAGGAAASSSGDVVGAAGVGVGTAINPSPSVGDTGPSAPLRYFSGGGGGGNGPGTSNAPGAYGGGGDGGQTGSTAATAGATNTGGGGGGGDADDCTSGAGGSGGSGIVIIRYKYQ